MHLTGNGTTLTTITTTLPWEGGALNPYNTASRSAGDISSLSLCHHPHPLAAASTVGIHSIRWP